MNFKIFLFVFCIIKYTHAYSEKTEQIIQDLAPDYTDKYKIAFESILQKTDYVQLGAQITTSYIPGKVIGLTIGHLNKFPQIQNLASVGHTVYEAVESPSTFLNYITENPFESDAIKKKAKIKYNNKLIHNINSYIRSNAKTLEAKILRELKIEVHRLKLELANL